MESLPPLPGQIMNQIMRENNKNFSRSLSSVVHRSSMDHLLPVIRNKNHSKLSSPFPSLPVSLAPLLQSNNNNNNMNVPVSNDNNHSKTKPINNVFSSLYLLRNQVMIVQKLRQNLPKSNMISYAHEAKILEKLYSKFEQKERQTRAEETSDSYHKSLSLCLLKAQAAFLLSHYALFDKLVAKAHDYVCESIVNWRFANKLCSNLGIQVTPKHDPNTSMSMKLFNSNQTDQSNIELADVGYYWVQLSQCYIMAGNILVAHNQFIDADSMYRTSLDLCLCMVGRHDVAVCDALEHLVNMHVMRHSGLTALAYCHELLNVIQNLQKIDVGNYNIYKHSMCKALYSCLLCCNKSNPRDMEYGKNIRYELLNECQKDLKIGNYSSHLFTVYVYFIKHCIQNCDTAQDDFNEADRLLNILCLEFTQKRNLMLFELNALSDLCKEYLFVMMEESFFGNTAFLPDHGSRVARLYDLHMNLILKLNRHPNSKKYKCNVDRIEAAKLYGKCCRMYRQETKANEIEKTVHELQSQQITNTVDYQLYTNGMSRTFL